jgi:hypothetical protein
MKPAEGVGELQRLSLPLDIITGSHAGGKNSHSNFLVMEAFTSDVLRVFDSV